MIELVFLKEEEESYHTCSLSLFPPRENTTRRQLCLPTRKQTLTRHLPVSSSWTLQPPELETLFKPPSLWNSLIAAQTD